MRLTTWRGRSRFERLYSLVVLFKGLDGTVELIAGLLLLIAPQVTGTALIALAGELAEGGAPIQGFAAQALDSAGLDATIGAVGVALFLLVHGVVKLVTVYALIRRLVRWYPWAIGALGALLVAQGVDLAVAPSAGGWVLAALDVIVIVLVAWEYRRLRIERTRTHPEPALHGTQHDREASAARRPGRG